MTDDEIRNEIFSLIKAAPLWHPPGEGGNGHASRIAESDGPPLEEPPGEEIIEPEGGNDGRIDDGTGADAEREPEASSESGKPDVFLGADEHRVIVETLEGLRPDPDLYQRGHVLVRVTTDKRKDGIRRAAGAPTIGILPPASLREKITRYVNLKRMNEKKVPIPAHPPGWLVSGIDARGEWETIRHLDGVSETPILRPDGSLCQTPGYDAATCVLYVPNQSFPVLPDSLEHEDAWRASESLLEIVADFPFESPEHRAAWLAALLTPLARYAFEGPSPFFLIDANVRGAGKGLLAQTIGWVVLGTDMPVNTYTHDPDELRKRITSIVLAGDRLYLLDNIEGTLGNAVLDAALTATVWKDRLLGLNQEKTLPHFVVYYGTSNNCIIAGDTARRTIHIRIDVMQERPEERTGFRHPNLLGWLRRERPRLLMDALAILSAYIRAGRPQADLVPLGSFEGWSDLIRQAIVWAGLPDPCATRARFLASADTAVDVLGEFIAALQQYDWAGRGIVVPALLRDLYVQGSDRTPEADRMRAAVENLCGVPPGKTPTPRQLAGRLRHFRRRVCGGFMLDSDEHAEREGRRWRLKAADGQAAEIPENGAGNSEKGADLW